MSRLGTQAPAHEAPAPRRRHHAVFAVAALVLGVACVAAAVTGLLGTATAAGAALGVVLGVIALFGARKAIALAGTILCTAGIAVSVGAASGDDPANAAHGQRPGTTAVTVTHPTWNTRYTWDNGLAIEVSAPRECTPSEYAFPAKVERAVQVSITLVNDTGGDLDTTLLSASEAQFGGRNAEQIFDIDGSCGAGPEPATILPGRTFTYEAAYAVGAAPGELQLVFQPGVGAPKAVFLGTA
ncbi:hypothetical protein BAY61_09340 [Prauserella marina]|uniref:Uncharacterized protein n=1 Tax=Prauserella marina TaxID=530584 RepID=A0A222VMS3_9PSEU|nr:hypothetical protein [Prauserella marina]ASR35152.1 hypothetical protein BAY61_09340 [Prauserella marina]PWV85086.1 hypothetical protein DES30_1011107 [Prauserella marina]SDC05106.1 hypothetical protein SAMN05421630_101231 [Prauserella marina]